MSQVEDPAVTLVRLLRTYLRVVKDDGSLANVHVSQEWRDRELMKDVDGQITVGLQQNEEQKLSFDGDLTRRSTLARISVYALDKPDLGVDGRAMRNRVRADVLRVIREKRSRPNVAECDCLGVGRQSASHKAFHGAFASDPVPDDLGWVELTDAEYQKLWYSDDDRFSRSVLESGKRAFVLVRFKIDADENVLKQAALAFEGHGTSPTGNGITVKAWNFVAGAWQNAAYGNAGNDQTLTIALSSGVPDFVGVDSYVYMLAATTNPSDGSTPAVLHCDYAKITFVVNGITYADVASFRDSDEVRVKPFLWRTEISVRTWLFETIQVT